MVKIAVHLAVRRVFARRVSLAKRTMAGVNNYQEMEA